MSFKILSHDEISVLSEYERKVYEQSYAEYLERVAFVEKLEQLEKVKMPDVSVKKKGIKRIKTPKISEITAQEFTADSSAGVNLLNVTKRASNALKANSQAIAIRRYKASLPDIFISNPNEVNMEEGEPFIIEPLSSVSIAIPQSTQYDALEYKTVIPNLQQCKTPELNDIAIEDYSISLLPIVDMSSPTIPPADIQTAFSISLPMVNTSMPDIGGICIQKPELASLHSVTIAKPSDVKAEIKEYEVSQATLNTVSAPIISYKEQSKPSVKLSPVPIPEYNNTPTEIEKAEIALPTVASVSAPDVNVQINQVKITKLREVCMPTPAPEVQINASAVKTTVTPGISIPEEIQYSEPDCQVEIIKPSLVKASQIDTEAELKKIMSIIR